ncbi:MAG: NADH-quinone oxidoreductase subunit J [Verrucomicrobia bacterium]|jgi:NADH-quinone oxidoreductase subunit J|nr:NADH-quinone oxidoreductase subunit J [Verrucomicrobiota bacterium]
MPGLTDLLFYAFAGMALLFGFLCVANPLSRNPVTSAMFLVLTIVSLAGLYTLLHAFFLAAVQILVYAGAVMVLFLFVIMLLDLKEEERRKIRGITLGLGALSVAVIAGILIRAVVAAEPLAGARPLLDGGTKELGRSLFTLYLLPFEVMSLLLLVGMVGVILLSKKELK